MTSFNASAANKPADTPAPAAAAAPPVAVKVEEPVQKLEPQSEDDEGERAGCQGDIQPVGHDYVEEVSDFSVLRE